VVGHGLHGAELVGHAQLGDELVDALHLAGAFGAARPAHHDEPRLGPVERGQRADGDVEALQRLDAADEEEHRSVTEVEVLERGARALPVPGGEERVVHTGRDQLDARRIGAVEPDELIGLGDAGREDGVRAPDHLGLGPDAALGHPVARLRLHPGEGVERRHQGQIELVLQPVPGDAGQPVVGVERVDVPERPEMTAYTVREGVDDVGELLLGQIGGAGLDVHHAEAGLDLDHVRAGVVPSSGEDVGRDPRLGQRRHQLADVDVHAAAVALAGLGER
jgi:hypothetical protein